MELHCFRDLISQLSQSVVETFLSEGNLYNDYLWPDTRMKIIQQKQDTTSGISRISNSY